MNTASSISMPRDPRDDDHRSWPVLARIPDVSSAAHRAPQRPPRAAMPAGAANYRVDRPQTVGGQASMPDRVMTSEDTDRVDHTAHAQRPPAHHLRHRAARTKPSDHTEFVDSPILPSWNPFTIPGSRLPDSFAPILSFLVLVALFTAAGTSLLMLRSSARQSASDSPSRAAPHVERSAAGPTATGPRGRTGVRLDPSPPTEPAAASLTPNPAPPPLVPSINEAADNNVTDSKRTTTGQPATPDFGEFPSLEDQSPIFPDSFPKTSEIRLPQAQMSDEPPAVARFSGEIREAQPRQAKHDDQSSIH